MLGGSVARMISWKSAPSSASSIASIGSCRIDGAVRVAAPAGLVDERQCEREDMLAFDVFVVAVGLGELGVLGRVRDEEVETRRFRAPRAAGSLREAPASRRSCARRRGRAIPARDGPARAWSLRCQTVIATSIGCRAGGVAMARSAQGVLGAGAARAVGALEAGRVDQRDRPGARSSARHHPLHDPRARRRAATRAAAQPARADARGARGDLPRRRRRRVGASDRCPSRPCALDDHARARPPRRPPPLPRRRGRPARLAAGAASAALQARPQPAPARARRGEARAGLVAAADRRLAEAQLPRRRDYAGVARDDLPDPVHPGARRVEARADRAPAPLPLDPPPARRQDAATRPGPDRRRRLDPRAARPRRKTGRSPATGKATCSPAPPTATSPRWSSATRAS